MAVEGTLNLRIRCRWWLKPSIWTVTKLAQARILPLSAAKRAAYWLTSKAMIRVKVKP